MTSSTKSALIERTIRHCALQLHPAGKLKTLAREMGCSPKVFRRWWAAGRVPRLKAEWLENRFGKEVADASELTD